MSKHDPSTTLKSRRPRVFEIQSDGIWTIATWGVATIGHSDAMRYSMRNPGRRASPHAVWRSVWRSHWRPRSPEAGKLGGAPTRSTGRIIRWILGAYMHPIARAHTLVASTIHPDAMQPRDSDDLSSRNATRQPGQCEAIGRLPTTHTGQGDPTHASLTLRAGATLKAFLAAVSAANAAARPEAKHRHHGAYSEGGGSLRWCSPRSRAMINRGLREAPAFAAGGGERPHEGPHTHTGEKDGRTVGWMLLAMRRRRRGKHAARSWWNPTGWGAQRRYCAARMALRPTQSRVVAAPRIGARRGGTQRPRQRIHLAAGVGNLTRGGWLETRWVWWRLGFAPRKHGIKQE
jgi:hypothetical protein